MERDSETDEHQRLQLGWLIATVLAVVLVVGYLVACMIAQSLDGTRGHWWWLWSYKFEEQGSWFDVARTTAALVAIPGAAVALAITYARHHATERQIEQAVAESRALESRELARRVNEQYVQAVDQLRDESAVARIAGMHALDRLAQEHADLRAVVVDVWCAYLRIKRPSESGEMTADEREVRATCTRLMLGHLRPGEPTRYWSGATIRIDLSGADLRAHWDAQRCTFPDRSSFERATFDDGMARFDQAQFGADCTFDGTMFFGSVTFDESTFADSVWFVGARFYSGASFGSAVFRTGVVFDGAQFQGHAVFHGATFVSDASFGNVSFLSAASFAGATFGDFAAFGGSSFGAGTSFERVRFVRLPSFDGVRFGAHQSRRDGTWWLHEQPDADETQGLDDVVAF